jgi:hypothetical protein
MAWLRVDDTALTHPKVIRLRALSDDVVSPEAVVGFVMLAASWSGQHLTDCAVPMGLGPLASPHWERLSAAAVKVGMLSRPRKLPDGQRGWMVVIDDKLFHLMSRAEVERNREHRGSTRRNDAKAAVLERDGDQCRYCGLTVNPKDGVGKRGRQFDHPDPAVDDVFVVACRGCNAIKGDRTPAEAGMPLLDPPASPHFHPSTRLWLDKHGTQRPGTQPAPAPARNRATGPADAATTRPGTAPDTAQPSPAADQARDQTTDRPPGGGAEHHGPGRVGAGSGRAGLGGDTAGAHPAARDGPPRPQRTRGRRGRRARPPGPTTGAQR